MPVGSVTARKCQLRKQAEGWLAPTWSNINKQTVRSHHTDTMALPSGIFTIENVKYRNWAMLYDANEGDVVAGSSPSVNVGEKVRTLEM